MNSKELQKIALDCGLWVEAFAPNYYILHSEAVLKFGAKVAEQAQNSHEASIIAYREGYQVGKRHADEIRKEKDRIEADAAAYGDDYDTLGALSMKLMNDRKSCADTIFAGKQVPGFGPILKVWCTDMGIFATRRRYVLKKDVHFLAEMSFEIKDATWKATIGGWVEVPTEKQTIERRKLSERRRAHD